MVHVVSFSFFVGTVCTTSNALQIPTGPLLSSPYKGLTHCGCLGRNTLVGPRLRKHGIQRITPYILAHACTHGSLLLCSPIGCPKITRPLSRTRRSRMPQPGCQIKTKSRLQPVRESREQEGAFAVMCASYSRLLSHTTLRSLHATAWSSSQTRHSAVSTATIRSPQIGLSLSAHLFTTKSRRNNTHTRLMYAFARQESDDLLDGDAGEASRGPRSAD